MTSQQTLKLQLAAIQGTVTANRVTAVVVQWEKEMKRVESLVVNNEYDACAIDTICFYELLCVVNKYINATISSGGKAVIEDEAKLLRILRDINDRFTYILYS